MMGIVHHSNYLRFCEEARVQFCEKMQLLDLNKFEQPITISDDQQKGATKLEQVSSLAVLHSVIKYLKPLRFHDEFEIQMQGRQEGVRLILQYKIFLKSAQSELCAIAETHHCRVEFSNANGNNTKAFRVLKPSRTYLEKTKELPWTETWL